MRFTNKNNIETEEAVLKLKQFIEKEFGTSTFMTGECR